VTIIRDTQSDARSHGISWEQVDDLLDRVRREHQPGSTAASLADVAARLGAELKGSLRLLSRTLGPGRNTAHDRLLADLDVEVDRQDQFHPVGYPATRDGVFLGIKTAVHELDHEAIDAWRGDRCRCQTPLCGHAEWQNTRAEMLQAAAVILRTIRSIDESLKETP
jgi:hypothetical protein